MKTIKINLIFLCSMISLLSLAQEQDAWWQSDGTLRIENGEYTFKSPIVPHRENIHESEMMLVDLDKYIVKSEDEIHGINSKDLDSNESTTLSVYHRKKLDESDIDTPPNYGFDFNENDYLIYGCETWDRFEEYFTDQEKPWDAYGYYAHGWSFSNTEIKSTDYTHLYKRPRSANWNDSLLDIGVLFLVITVGIIVGVATGGAGFLGIAAVAAGTTVSAFSIAGHVKGYGGHFSDYADHQLISQLEFSSQMETPVPDKYQNPENDYQKNWNKLVDSHHIDSFDCTDTNSQGLKCYKAAYSEVVVEMQVKNAHVKHINIPGALHKNLTPYQIFKNYNYVTDITGYLRVSNLNQKAELKDVNEVFQDKRQPLPRNLIYASTETSYLFEPENFADLKTYYVVAKDPPSDLHELLYKDLGVYGIKGGHEFRMYRYQVNADITDPIQFTTGPDGPFLVGDNISIGGDENPDLTISIFSDKEEIPSIVQTYSFDLPRPANVIRFQPGDSVVFSSKHRSFYIDNVPEIWLTRFAGESKYYCTPSIEKNQYKPFLGFDSQVHGVAIRRYPEKTPRKTPITKIETANVNFEIETSYSWYWIAQRRMDPEISHEEYSPTGSNIVFPKFKDKDNFGGSSFPIGGGQSVDRQRNSQREGYNMQLLTAWGNGFEDKTYDTYRGPGYILGLDPDEIVYINSNFAEIKSSEYLPEYLLKTNVEKWKQMPEGEDKDPIAMMVEAYQQNRNILEGGNSAITPYEGYEIMDKGNYIQTDIAGVAANNGPCNGKPCVKYYPNGGIDDNNIKAPGEFEFKTLAEGQDINAKFIKIRTVLKSIQSEDNGFYGSIEGDQWPSESQRQVPYSFTGLAGVPKSILNKLVMEYSFENELGILTKVTRHYRDSGSVVDGKWTEKFDLNSWGYNEITVYAQRKDKATMVPIAGMELLEVKMRFLSVPGSNHGDFFPTPSTGPDLIGIDLKEGRGEGNFWYLRDYNNDASDNPKYGKPIDDINKNYTVSKEDRIVFNAIDSDPHTFFHYNTDWYVSERFMSKRILENELNNRVHWFISHSDYDGLGTKVGTGRSLDYTFSEPGQFRLTAVYGNHFDKEDDNYEHSRMSHEITVRQDPYIKEDINSTKGTIDIHLMSDDQIGWLKEKSRAVKSSWMVAEVDNIFSEWTHLNGPRSVIHNEKQNRYGLENDYNAHFKWFNVSQDVNSQLTETETDVFLIDVGQNANSQLTKTETDVYLIDDPNLEWFPSNWIRHYSGTSYPDDMEVSRVSGGVTTDQSELDAALNLKFPLDTPEPWQWRLPWVSITDWQGYRTRNNIKAIYNMAKLFDNDTGAFAGVGIQGMTNEEYASSVDNALPELTDQRKSKYDFYLDLLSGRKIAFDPSHTDPGLLSVNQVDDVNSTENIVIANASRIEVPTRTFLKGADVSIVSNLEEGGIIWTKSGVAKTPYEILSEAGANVARFRLWVDPIFELLGSNRYQVDYDFGKLELVKLEIAKAKNKDLKIILDLHYSDTWADPKQNIIPGAWEDDISNTPALVARVENYTKMVLDELHTSDLLPDIIQIGNEINSHLLLSKAYEDLEISEIAQEIGVTESDMNGDKFKVNWDRKAKLINAGLNAVKTYYPSIKTMLHFAGALNAQFLTSDAFTTNAPHRLGTEVVDQDKVDIIGISYYPGEPDQKESLSTLKQVIESIGSAHHKEVLIAETAFPHTYGWSDNTSNLYGQSNRGKWPENTSSREQLEWLNTLKNTLKSTRHSIGFVYWEPFWVGSNEVNTKDIIGSNWENMTFFSFTNGEAQISNELDLNGGINVFSDIPIQEDQCSEARELPYSTSFEEDWGGWTHKSLSTNHDWERTSVLTIGNILPTRGEYFIYAESVQLDGDYESSAIESPCFTLGNLLSPKLLFRYNWYGNFPSGSFFILIAKIGENNEYTNVFTSNPDGEIGWQYGEILLDDYIGSTIKIRIVSESGTRIGGIAIDEISLIEDPFPVRRGTTDNETNDPVENREFKVFPNPVTDELMITFSNSINNKVELSDIQGRLIYTKVVKDTYQHRISVKKLQLNSGIILIRVISDDGTSNVQKIVVK